MTIVGLFFHGLARRMTHPCTLAAAPSPPLPTKTPAIFVPLLHLNLRSSTTSSFSNMSATIDWDTIFKLKKSLRFKIKKELKSMDPILRSQEDDAIQRIVLESPWFKTCKRLCAYITCAALREVDTSKLLLEILKSTEKDGQYQVRKTLYVPRVEDKNSHMRMLNISTMDDLIANSMNILEPAPLDAQGNELENVMLANEPVDLFLLPGLAFDKSGRRLGRGGGYYDTILTKYQELAEERKWQKPLFEGAYGFYDAKDDKSSILEVPSDTPNPKNGSKLMLITIIHHMIPRTNVPMGHANIQFMSSIQNVSFIGVPK